MAPILLYHAFKTTTLFVDAFVNELRQLLPSTNDCLLQFSVGPNSLDKLLATLLYASIGYIF